MSLATKYRPTKFDENLIEQTSTKNILKKQLDTKTFSNTYLLCGPSGDGKTTIARIFANELNHGYGTPIEIDGASNNGVDNVRDIIEDAKQRALDAEYKVYIIDECHQITTSAWNAFLKCIEEPPKYTIFIFCTTDPQKIPDTILNRCQRFNLSKISTKGIRDRLLYICQQEGYSNYDEACEFIAKLAEGGMRTAISYLEKCVGYSSDLSIQNVIHSLGNFSYETFLKLTNNLVDGNQKEVLSIIDDVYDSGKDLKIFIEQYLSFALDLNKYCLFKDISATNIPSYLEKPKSREDKINVYYAVGFDDSLQYLNKLVNALLELKTSLKYDTTSKLTVSVKMINICRGIM